MPTPKEQDMKTWEVSDPITKKRYLLTGYEPPTDTEIEELIESSLPQASIEERVLANALSGGDETKRREYLRSRGKTYREPGWAMDEPGFIPKVREYYADLLETGLGAGGRFAAQTGGEILGGGLGATAGTAVGGPIGAGIGAGAGYVAGGATGRAGAQLLAEQYANMRGMGLDETRVPLEAATGGLTSAVGGSMGLIGKAIPKAILRLGNSKLGRKWNDWALSNLTQYSSKLQDFTRNKVLPITNLAKTPSEAFDKMYILTKNSLKNVFKQQDDLGKIATQARLDFEYSPGAKVARPGLSRKIRDIVNNYLPRLEPSQEADVIGAAKVLEDFGGDAIPRLETKADMFNRLISEGIEEKEANAQVAAALTREKAEELYRDALAIETKIYKWASTESSKPLNTMAREVGTAMNSYLPDLSPSAEISKMIEQLDDKLLEKNLKKPSEVDEAMKWLYDHLFGDYDTEGMVPLEKLLNKYVGAPTTDLIKKLVAAGHLRSGIMKASFGKLTAPGLLGSQLGSLGATVIGGGVLGAGIGAAASKGDRQQIVRAAKIGSGIGFAAALPYASPSWNTAVNRLLESGTPPSVITLLQNAPKLVASPLMQAVQAISGSFGITPEAEDLEILKGSRRKALSTTP